MKNLIQKIAQVVLAGIIAIAPIYADNKTVDLRNGYTAESYLAADELDLIASAKVREVILEKTDNGYAGRKTGIYLQSSSIWNNVFDNVCESADKIPDKFITNKEAQDLLDSTYNDDN